MPRTRKGEDGDMITGILCVDKPSGMTSHDVVRRVRHLSRQRRVGHAGTLDPMATGVLLLCLGRATRISEYLVDGSKAYRARVRLGQETNTWDADGELTAELPVPELSAVDIERACQPFVGEIDQIPPMFSAIKQDGKPLYKLARKGIQVERKPRSVVIHDISLVELQPPFVMLDVVCSKGTYIRSLAHDLGVVLGTGAHLADLVRTKVGSFDLETAVTLARLESCGNDWTGYLTSMSDALDHMQKASITEDDSRRLVYGQNIELGWDNEGLIRAVNCDGELIALLSRADEPGWWRPVKVLHAV